ncbi:CHAT domain-containing protein [Lactifluus subvellereus]|nr:CHAT domain-containing protein [Lactifluus subvellereus]
MRDIEEMGVLCHELLELLADEIWTGFITDSITALAETVLARITKLGWSQQQELPQQVIECLREANKHLPDWPRVSVALAWSLFNRFRESLSTDDCDEAMAVLDKIIASRAPEHGLIPNSNEELALMLITTLAVIRSNIYGNPEYLEEGIHRMRTLLGAVSRDHPHRHTITTGLAHLLETRFQVFGVTEGLQEARSSSSGVFGLETFRNRSASLARPNAIKSPPMSAVEESQHVDALLAIDCITDIADIEEAIKYCRTLATSSHPSDLFTPLPAVALVTFLLRAFQHTHKIEYLNELIAALRDVPRMSGARHPRFIIARQLISSLSDRLRLLHNRDDYDEIMQLFQIAVNDSHARVPDRFQLSCEWASWTRYSKHPDTPTAYEKAISLLQDSLTFAPTLEVQHSRLVAMRHSYEKLPLDYASYQVHTGRLEQAIETLERGRALLWSEMRGLRTSTDQLREAASSLAEQFVTVNRDLETLTMSVVSGRGVKTNDEVDGHERMDPFGRLVVQQRKLLEERERLISQIQALPRFEGFLKSPQFDTVRSAASHGPVIIINHCEWRSDILILLHDSAPSLIITPHDFYDHANSLRDRLLNARREGLESKQYEDALSSVLKGLYDLVGRPVIQRLCQLNVPEQSRVWLCPTSVFCSLPLHAMGPIPSDDGMKQYFSDLYIPSYTPTLSSLIESRKLGTEIFVKPSILLVAHPDEFMPEAFEEIQIVQAVKTQVTTLMSAKATPTAVLGRLQDHRFAHFVCHGILELGRPFDASFKLFQSKRLTLLDIVRSRLPNAEFAFLSACHTAELTGESLADEALHLSAAMQYCGFRSVVGTMWAMADTDGRDLAGNFYKSVFSGRRQGVPYYARTAKALRDAVKKLRRKRGVTLERWVNFVHYGA